MMKMWNNEQLKAIQSINKNTIVSASAGSGKTSVLVERIIRLVRGDIGVKVPVSKLLVLSFSRAVAQEMKEKVGDAIREEIKNSLDGEYLRQQLDDLPLSNITTVHSFCSSLIKQYFEEIGIDPSFTIMDEDETESSYSKALSECFEEYEKKQDLDYSNLKYYFGSIDELKSRVKSFYFFRTSLKDEKAWKKKAIEAYKTSIEESDHFKQYVNYIKSIFLDIKEYYDLIIGGLIKLSPKLQKYKQDADFIADIADSYINLCSDYNAFYKTDLSQLNPGRKKIKPKEMEPFESDFLNNYSKLRDKFKYGIGILKKYYDIITNYTEEARKNVLYNLEKFFEITDRTAELYLEIKREDNKLDYNDLETYVVQILSKKSVADAVKEEFEYVCVDEYQDINEKQEYIITSVAKEGRIFFVGDAKQSIFGFRNSDTEIFLNKYYEYKENNGGKTIELNYNYRSEWGILNFVNDVFSKIMTRKDGGIDYAKTAMFDTIKEKVIPEKCVEILCMETPNSSKELNIYDEGVYSVERHQYDKKDIDLFSEAMYIADRIKSTYGRVIKVKENGVEKEIKLKYSDMVLLVRSRSEQSNRIVEYLDSVGIPIYGSEITKSGADELIELVKNVLKLIDNFNQDYPLLIVMSSQIGGFSFSELDDLRQLYPREKFMHECVIKAAEAGKAGLNKVCIKAYEFRKEIERLNQLSQFLAVSNLIEEIVEKIRGKLSVTMAGSESLDKLDSFVRAIKGKSLDVNITDFLQTLESRPEFATPKPRSSTFYDCVNTSTVHHSKGLEYPVVFLITAGKRFSNKELTKKILYDKVYGIAIKPLDLERREFFDGLDYEILSIKERKKIKDEEMRLLYVALTRAKYLLFISGVGAKNQDGDCSSYMNWFQTVANDNETFKNNYFTSFTTTSNQSSSDIVIYREYRKQDNPLVEEIRKYIDSKYAYENATTLGIKYTVTAINKDRVNSEEEEAEVILSHNTSFSAETGIAFHKIMQEIDYDANSIEEIKLFIKQLMAEGKISEEVDAYQIKKCLDSKLIKLARNNKSFREKAFKLYLPAKEVLNNGMDEEIIVQGIIDLLIMTKDSKTGEDICIVADFKKSSLPTEAIVAKYKGQLELYAKAIEYILGVKKIRKQIYIFGKDEAIEID